MSERGSVITIACGNLKGGVGKTTCAVNLGAGLSRLGWRVLLVDADPQAHLTASLGLVPTAHGGLAGVLDGHPIRQALCACGTMDVLAGSPTLAAMETGLADQLQPWRRLETALAGLTGYDVALLDCPPHWGRLTQCAIRAASGLIVPMTPDYLALQSLAWFNGVLRESGLQGRPMPPVVGIVINRFSPRKRLHREVLAAVGGHFPGLPFATRIRDNVSLAEAPSHGLDIFRYAPHSAGAMDFSALCAELADRVGLTTSAVLTAADPRRIFP